MNVRSMSLDVMRRLCRLPARFKQLPRARGVAKGRDVIFLNCSNSWQLKRLSAMPIGTGYAGRARCGH